MIDRTTISAIAGGPGVSSNTFNTIAMRALAELIAAASPPRRAGLLRQPRLQRTPPMRSTAAWKPYAATPSDSATSSPTAGGAHSCTAEHSTHWSMHSEITKSCQTSYERLLRKTQAQPVAGSVSHTIRRFVSDFS